MSAYPSCNLAANVSRDTSVRELLEVEGLDFESVVKLENINLLINKTNSVQYMSKMCNFPTLEQLDGLIK
nr:MAG TPA: DNA polymerase [Caudoviricetes sp.]